MDDYTFTSKEQYNLAKRNYPNTKYRKKDFTIKLRKYKRQCLPTTNNNGEKEVWINCFCDDWNTNWKKEILFAFDGGNCYFNI